MTDVPGREHGEGVSHVSDRIRKWKAGGHDQKSAGP